MTKYNSTLNNNIIIVVVEYNIVETAASISGWVSNKFTASLFIYIGFLLYFYIYLYIYMSLSYSCACNICPRATNAFDSNFQMYRAKSHHFLGMVENTPETMFNIFNPFL